MKRQIPIRLTFENGSANVTRREVSEMFPHADSPLRDEIWRVLISSLSEARFRQVLAEIQRLDEMKRLDQATIKELMAILK